MNEEENKQVGIGDQIQTPSYHIGDEDGKLILARVVSVHADGIYATVEDVMAHIYPSEIFRSWNEFEIVSLKA